MITDTNAVTFRQNLGEMLNQVRYRRDSVVINKDGKPVAVLVDVRACLKSRSRDAAQGKTGRKSAAYTEYVSILRPVLTPRCALQRDLKQALRLFERIRRMQDRFDALCRRIEKGFSDVPETEGPEEIASAVAEVRGKTTV